MASHEYYLGTKGAHELSGNHSYTPQPPQQPPRPYNNVPVYANTPPPNYSPYPQPPQHHQGYPSQQPYPEKPSHATTAPYPQTPPSGYHSSQQYMMPQPHQQLQKNNYLGVPMQPVRSHSQPPARVHFADDDSDASTSLGSISDSDEASPPRHHHRQSRHRSHSRPERAYSPNSSYTDRSYERDDRPRRHKYHDKDKSHSGAHKTRDTFLGAGAGTIIGDAIFPGLGTAAGLVLGGYGGRKYARERSRSDVGGKDREREKEKKGHGGNRRVGIDGWDDRTKTFKKGGAVR